LRKGDSITVTMPYGRFTYTVERRRIVDPNAIWVIDRVGYNRLVLTACHPLYSAAQRIVVFARLVRTQPLGAAAAGSRENRFSTQSVRPMSVGQGWCTTGEKQ